MMKKAGFFLQFFFLYTATNKQTRKYVRRMYSEGVRGAVLEYTIPAIVISLLTTQMYNIFVRFFSDFYSPPPPRQSV